MTLAERFRAFFGVEKIGSGTGGEKITPTGYEATGISYSDDSNAKKTEYLNEMKGWVGSAVFAIADSVASIEIKLFKKTKNGIEEVEDHPILDLLFRVNGFTTYFDHFWLTQSYLELTGEAPWFLDRNGSEIENIFFLRPDKIKPIAGKSNLIEGYEYEIKPGETIKLSVDDVLFLKYPNPAEPFRGLGTLKMAALTVDIDNFSETWNANFYKNSARPDSIITVKSDNMNKEQKDRLKKSLEELYQGTKNAHKNMVLFGDMSFDTAGFNQKDMDFDNQQKFSRDKILGIFRVPKAIVSQTEGVNFASAKVAEYIFLKFTIKPKMERLIQQLNEFLLPMFAGTEEMYLEMKNPVPADDEKDVIKYNSALTHGWMTINEVREEQGLDPLEGGDVAYIPMNRIELGEEAEGGGTEDKPSGKPDEEEKPKEPIDENKPEEEDKNKGYRVLIGKRPQKTASYGRRAGMRARSKIHFEAKKTTDAVKEAIKNELRRGLMKKNVKKIPKKMSQIVKKTVKVKEVELQRVFSEQEVLNYWEVKNQIFQEFVKKVEKDLKSIFAIQRKSTLLKLSKAKGLKGTDDLYGQIRLDDKKEIARTLDLTFGTFSSLFEKAGNETFDMMQIDAEMNIDREEVRNIIRDNGRIFAKGVTETTNKFIREQMIDGLGKGESIPELKKRIVKVFDSAGDMRAQRIARTETLRYNTSASEQAFKDSGVVEGKMWITDPEPCQYCATLAGKTAKLGDNFVSKGDVILDRVFDYDDLPSPPAHPNCQCDVIPVFKPVQVDLKQINIDLDTLYAKASLGKKQIDGIGRSFVRKVKNGKLSAPRIKNRQRALEKVVDKYRGDVRKLTDVTRNTVVVSSEKDFIFLARTVLRDSKKNGMVSYSRAVGSIDEFGYSGINVKFKTNSGVVGEMQINTSWMIYAKEKSKDAIAILGQDTYDRIAAKVKVGGGKGHEFYVIGRSTKDAVLKAKVQKESIEYYNLIRRRIGDGI